MAAAIGACLEAAAASLSPSFCLRHILSAVPAAGDEASLLSAVGEGTFRLFRIEAGNTLKQLPSALTKRESQVGLAGFSVRRLGRYVGADGSIKIMEYQEQLLTRHAAIHLAHRPTLPMPGSWTTTPARRARRCWWQAPLAASCWWRPRGSCARRCSWRVAWAWPRWRHSARLVGQREAGQDGLGWHCSWKEPEPLPGRRHLRRWQELRGAAGSWPPYFASQALLISSSALTGICGGHHNGRSGGV